MEKKQKLVIDTNQWINLSLKDLEQLTNDYDIHIPITVVEELDNLKYSQNGQLAYDTRKAIRFIYNNYNKFKFIQCDDNILKNDNKIIEVAKTYDCAICSGDLNMKIKCKGLKIPIIKTEYEEGEYKGYKIIELDINNDTDNQVLASIYEQTSGNLWDLYINQYLIIKDKNNKNTIDMFRWDGKKLNKLKLPPKKIIEPLNDLQACALDLLMDKDIPIKIIAGSYGSGKTKISTDVGIYLVEGKGQYSKLVLIRNNDLQDSGKDVGYLPGDILDKTNLLFETVMQYFPQGKYQADKMRMEGKMETHITHFIKGLSINGYIICDESEDLTVKDIKLIGSRLEKDSCIVFSGDWKQANGKYKKNNGIKHLIDKTKGNSLVGIVVLDENVRSEASKVFTDLI